MGLPAQHARRAGALAGVARPALAAGGAHGLGLGITSDEFSQRAYGEHVLAWYTSGFKDQSAVFMKFMHVYGGLFDLPVQWLISRHVLPLDDFDVRHVASSLVAVLGICATWLTVRRIAGPRAALLGAACLALTPAWLGHGLFNPKDIPFGATAAFTMAASARIVMRRPPITWSDAALAGLALGCTLGVRSGGMFMLAYPVLAVCLRCASELQTRRSAGATPQLRAALVSFSRLLCMLPLTWLLMLSAWPWAQLEPFTRPLEGASIAAHFAWQGQMRFAGEIISEQNIPWYYLPTWFGKTLPDLYVLVLACGLIAAFSVCARRRLTPRVAATCLLLFLAFGPLLAVLVRRPTIYDAHRHFLFLLPPLAALAGLALEHVFAGRYPGVLRVSIGCAWLGLAAWTARDMWLLHPYEYVYFNHLNGGLEKQAPKFETDYWGSSYREAFAWVVQHYDPGGTRKIMIKTCSSDKAINYYSKQWHAERFVIARTPQAAEVFLDPTRAKCGKVRGEEIHRIERERAPLLYILHPAR